MSIDTGKTSFNELQESSAGAFYASVASWSIEIMCLPKNTKNWATENVDVAKD